MPPPAGETPGPAGPTEAPTIQPSPTPFKAELVICTNQEPDALINAQTASGRALLPAVSPPAVLYGDGYAPSASLFTGLPSQADDTLRANDDGTITVTLQYREGLVWSDGEPFKVEDALLGFTQPADPGAPRAEIVDARPGEALTVTVTLAQGAEYPYVPSQPPLPSHKFPAPVDLSSYVQIVDPSLGSYYVAEWTPGQNLLLRANPHAAPAPVIPDVRVRFLDQNAVAAELVAGTCDAALNGALSAAQVPPLQEAAAVGRLRLVTIAGSLQDELAFNTYPPLGRIPLFADPLVRQAVAAALDRAAIASQSTGSLSSPQDSWLPPTHPFYSPGLAVTPPDVSRAASLLDQAGWQDLDGDGIREYQGTGGSYACQRGDWAVPEKTPLTPVLITSSDPQSTQAANLIKAALASVGIQVQIQGAEPSVVFAQSGPIVTRQFDMAVIPSITRSDPGGISRWVGEDVYRHPLDKTLVHRWQLEDRWLVTDQQVERLADSNVPSDANAFQGQNYTGWCNEQADILAVQANLGFNLDERKAAYAQLQSLLASDVPAIPLFSIPDVSAAAVYVCGLKPGPVDPVTWNLAAWTFDPSGACAN